MSIFKANDFKKGIAAALNNIGIVYSDLADYPKALAYYEKALKIRREIGGSLSDKRLNG